MVNRRRRWTLRNIEIQLSRVIAHARPLIEKQALATEAEWLRDHPAVRTCYLCKRRHRNPRPLTVLTSTGPIRRWVSARCWHRKTGTPVNAGGMQVWQVVATERR